MVKEIMELISRRLPTWEFRNDNQLHLSLYGNSEYGCSITFTTWNATIEVAMFESNNFSPDHHQSFELSDPDCFHKVVAYALEITKEIRWSEFLEED